MEAKNWFLNLFSKIILFLLVAILILTLKENRDQNEEFFLERKKFESFHEEYKTLEKDYLQKDADLRAAQKKYSDLESKMKVTYERYKKYTYFILKTNFQFSKIKGDVCFRKEGRSGRR